MDMDEWKNFLASRTVWANAVGLLALILSAIGVDADIDRERVVDSLLQVVAGLSFLASTAFRVAATRRLTM
jgi:hypothetical protein